LDYNRRAKHPEKTKGVVSNGHFWSHLKQGSITAKMEETKWVNLERGLEAVLATNFEGHFEKQPKLKGTGPWEKKKTAVYGSVGKNWSR